MSYPDRYKDKVVLITASSTGIGLAIATRMAHEGGTVIITSRNQKHVDSAVESITSKGLKALGLVVNVGNKADIEKLIKFIEEKFNKLDALVCNAAVSLHLGPTLEISEEKYDKMFDVNVKSIFFLIQGLYPLLKKTKGANILIMSSIAVYDSHPQLGVYAINKTILNKMTKVLAQEFALEEGPYKIRVNAIAPGVIKTRFSEALWKGKEKQTVEDRGMVRLGVPEDIANLAALVCSDNAGFLTGEVIAPAGKTIPRL